MKTEFINKTKNGHYQVHLCSHLAQMLRECVGKRPSGLLFRSSTSAELLQPNTLSDSLHPILDCMAHERGSFNIFHRFRLTHLEKPGFPNALKHFWSAHTHKHVSERYVKLGQDREFRLSWGIRSVLDFGCQEPQLGSLGNSCNLEKRSKLLKEMVDGRGFEPPASSLRTMRSPS